MAKIKKSKKKAVHIDDEDGGDYFAKLAADEGETLSPHRRIKNALREVENEVSRAVALHGPMKSCHEGYAVLKEEVDELWDEIKKKSENRSNANLREEAIQIAAMATRFVVDLL